MSVKVRLKYLFVHEFLKRKLEEEIVKRWPMTLRVPLLLPPYTQPGLSPNQKKSRQNLEKEVNFVTKARQALFFSISHFF
jgi:hypothetical protein